MNKPYIKLGHIVLEIISFILIFGTIIYVVVWMQSVEGEIPTHFSMNGEIDGYGSPSFVLFMPICMLITDLIMAICMHFVPPQTMSYPIKIKPGREIIVLTDNMWMVAILELIMAVYSLVFSIQFAYTMGGMFASTIVFLVATFGDIIFWMVAQIKHNNA